MVEASPHDHTHRYLREDVDAIAVLVHHAVDAADLSFQAAQTIAVRRLVAERTKGIISS